MQKEVEKTIQRKTCKCSAAQKNEVDLMLQNLTWQKNNKIVSVVLMLKKAFDNAKIKKINYAKDRKLSKHYHL